MGHDAVKLLAGRAAMTDEAYVAFGAAMTIDEFASAFNDTFGIEI